METVREIEQAENAIDRLAAVAAGGESARDAPWSDGRAKRWLSTPGRTDSILRNKATCGNR
jgi:hypothetical protein